MKAIVSILLVLALLLPCAAFAQSASPSYYPITVTDQAGREVTINEQPERLISVYYIASSLLIALDLDDQMVGIENKPNTRPIYALSAPELLSLPTVGTAKMLDLELCASLNPDLMILPMKLKGSVKTLESLGFNVLLVDPEDQERLYGMIELVAAATNHNEKAQELLSFIEQQQAFLGEALADADKPSVYLAGNSDLLKTAGNAMYQADMIRLAGGVNAAQEITDTYWAEIDYEQLLAWNPEYIILAAEADYTVEDVLSDPNLADCAAVVSKNVYQLPNQAEAWDSPVPASILGAVWLANILHSDKVSAEECAARMNAYYETFYQFTYSQK